MQINDTLKPSKEIDYNTLTVCADLFTVFSNIDALKIFLYAERGIVNSTLAIKELNLTPKRFYSRLKELMDCGLIDKIDGKYGYTPTGKVMAKLGYTLVEVLNNKERIELILNLSSSHSLTIDERFRINNLLLENSEIGNLVGPIVNGISYGKVETVSNYDELVKRINEELDNTKETVLFATTYFDPIVLDVAVKTIKRGVQMKCLMSKKVMSQKITKLRMLLSPKSILNLIEMFKSTKDINQVYREVEVPFSVCILDGQRCFFEFPQLSEGDFSIAFYLVDKGVSEKFTEFFFKMWEENEKGSGIELFKSFNNL